MLEERWYDLRGLEKGVSNEGSSVRSTSKGVSAKDFETKGGRQVTSIASLQQE